MACNLPKIADSLTALTVGAPPSFNISLAMVLASLELSAPEPLNNLPNILVNSLPPDSPIAPAANSNAVPLIKSLESCALRPSLSS